MTCDELRPDYLLYAMGTLEEPERSEMQAHLARGCPECTEGLRQAQALSYSMGVALTGPDAPRELRSRVLGISAASPASERPAPAKVVAISSRWGRMLAAACLVLSAGIGLLWLRDSSELHSREAAASRQAADAQASIASLREQLAKIKDVTAVAAAAIFALDVERGSANEAPKQIAIPRGVASIVLALPTDVVRQAVSAELRDGAGKTVWTLSPLPSSDADSTGLTLASDRLALGRYTVVLLAHDRTVARFPFEVTIR